jgi:hypothetical protein
MVDGGTLDQWAGQLTLVEQLADATTTVAQAAGARRPVGEEPVAAPRRDGSSMGEPWVPP